MIRTLIVDDETLVRATLRTLVDWEALGYTIVQDCADGGQALEYLKDHPVDVLFTDMKMPSVGGIELLRSLRETPDAPVSIALSGYDEFELVREAFRLGAYDYLLKANLNADTLRALLEQLKEKFFRETAAQKQPEDAAEAFFRAEAGQYAVVLFQIDDFAAQASRFGSNLHEKLERPMLELARQIPRLAGRTCIRAVSPERYALRYRVQDASRFETTLPSVVRQVQAVWRDYMNLSVSAAISGLVRENELPAAEETCEKLLRMAPLSGKGAVCTLRREMAAAQAAEQLGKSCDLLIESVCTGNTAQAETEKTEFLHYAAVQSDPNAVLLALLAPATATVVIIKAITIINDMYIPYLYMPKNKLRTLTTFLMDYANAQQGSWQTLAAGIIVIMLPTILIYVFFQRYILAGIAAGAVKE